MLDRARQPAVGPGVPRARKGRWHGVSVLLGERVRSLLRHCRDDDGRRLQLDLERLVAGQVEGHVQGALDLREGRPERAAAPRPAGEQREQTDHELARHPGGAEREGCAGIEDHP